MADTVDNELPLDAFQETLLQMTTNASAAALSKFFSKNYRPLYQFILRLYLSSLTPDHPDRGHSSHHSEHDGYTLKEHKILAEWANLLTDDESAEEKSNLNHSITSIDTHSTRKHNQQYISQTPSPKISTSDTSPSPSPYATVSKSNHQKSLTHTHQSSLNTASIGFLPKPKKRAIRFDAASTAKLSNQSISEHADMKESYRRHRKNSERRGSMWDGLVDGQNIISVPEAPKWRPRFSFQQNQLLQDGLLNSILFMILPKGSSLATGANDLGLVDEVQVTSVDAMCLFLPLLCVMSSSTDTLLVNASFGDELQMAILERVSKQDDVKQHFQFLLNSYKDVHDLKKQFNQNNAQLIKQSAAKKKEAIMNSPHIGSTVAADASTMDDFTVSSFGSSPAIMSTTTKGRSRGNSAAPQPSMKPVSGGKVQHIVQKVPESAISLFQSIFRHQLTAGSEIKLCAASTVRDPMNCHAPPLSRIEVRKVIATNSKPLLVDLYVASRADNFEYLSSTGILKKGDDLRRDAAVLHVFRLMNKIWREQGLEFMQVPVNALTYKCVAMSPDMGMIELVEGCKPLRLVSALEDTITIAQQFNLVASAAGSYIASYVMGVRDRHFDNVLIRDNDCTLFHIDFGFLFGDTASVDTSKFAITSDLKNLMGGFWDKFVELGVQSFLALRQKHSFLVKYARQCFCYLNNPDMVEQFMKDQLLIDHMEDDKAAKHIARIIKESPHSVKTKFKNVVHTIATRKK